MEESVLLKDGFIVLPDETLRGSIRIKGESIEAIGDLTPEDQEEVLDCRGLYLLPGGIETHTHLQLESMGTVTADDFASGTRAALAGGTTTVIDFATQFHGETMAEGLRCWHQKADGKCAIDYGFHMALTEWNQGLKEEMESVVEGGVTSFKMYMAYKNNMMVQEDQIYDALEEAQRLGATIGFHCENGLLIDVLVRRERELGHLSPYYHQITRPHRTGGGSHCPAGQSIISSMPVATSSIFQPPGARRRPRQGPRHSVIVETVRGTCF